MIALRRSAPLWLLLGALATSQSCGENNAQLPNPLVRVDLRSRLPQSRAFRGRAQAALELDCHQLVPIESGGVHHDFVVNWRVIDVDETRYIVAVDVQPSGSLRGGRAPSASATVGRLERRSVGSKSVDEVLVMLAFSAQRGCGSVSKSLKLTIRSDHKSCAGKAPPPKPRRTPKAAQSRPVEGPARN